MSLIYLSLRSFENFCLVLCTENSAVLEGNLLINYCPVLNDNAVIFSEKQNGEHRNTNFVLSTVE